MLLRVSIVQIHLIDLHQQFVGENNEIGHKGVFVFIAGQPVLMSICFLLLKLGLDRCERRGSNRILELICDRLNWSLVIRLLVLVKIWQFFTIFYWNGFSTEKRSCFELFLKILAYLSIDRNRGAYSVMLIEILQFWVERSLILNFPCFDDIW